jgi:hypothetical protein
MFMPAISGPSMTCRGRPPPALDRDPGFFRVGGDEVGDAVHQRVAEALVDVAGAPGQPSAVVLRHALGVFGDLDQALARIRPAVEHHVFHALAQFGFEVVIHTDHAGVDDAHVQPRLDGVVQEDGVDRLAHRVVAAEAERHVRDAAADLGAGQVLLDPARRLDEIDGVVVVLSMPVAMAKMLGSKMMSSGRSRLVHQDPVRTLADLRLALEGVGLAFSSNAITTAAAP